MADYITAIRTTEGNKKYDYNALGNLPDIAQLIREQLASVSTSFISHITLAASEWQGNASPYAQTVAVEGATENSKIDLNPSIEQLAIFHEKDIAFVAENEDGVITVYCIGQKPTGDYTMQVTITEVTVNG
jgi:hypothetical protein